MPSVTARYRRIAEVLVRNGMSALADQIGLREHMTGLVYRHLSGDASGPVPGPTRLRRALEELGPTFVKLGQMLSTRRDMLPLEYTAELEKLQTSTSPVTYPQIAETIRRELGADPHELYDEFDETPLASASIGQAHKARLKDGTAVIVKVRKPGAAEMIHSDLDLMKSLAALASREWSLARDADIESVVASFDKMMRRELDYRTEAANARRLRRNLAEDRTVHIPRVYDELTTSGVLTEQFVTGMRITDAAALDAARINRRKVAHDATDSLLRMVLVDGFFHADPHPGNMFVESDGTIWLIDFGMVGTLTPEVREHLLWLAVALGRQDEDAVASALLQLAPPRRGVDRRRLTRDVSELVDLLTEKPLGEVSVSAVVERITALLRRHRLQLPADVSSLLRMLVLTESSAIALDPDFRVATVLEEVLPIAIGELLSPDALARRMGNASRTALRLGSELPQRALRLLDDYETRGVDVHIDAADLDKVITRMENTADRLIVGMTMSALLVGISTVLASQPSAVGRMRDPLLIGAGGTTALMGMLLAAGAGPVRTAGRFVRRNLRGS
ncbi:ABC1 kinase family protein [Brachybacterium muris]|uniref:ABC1 kinase family protein n=1 Tax=Brachybacterium muris TaxID=219301 RepID=UPI0023EE571E|nr:AarF/UbiB family protein [Brachybacterium muris]